MLKKFLVLLKRFDSLFTVRNSSCGKVMFHKRLSFCQEGGGMHGRGVCMAGAWVVGCVCGGGACMAGGMHGRGRA